MNDVRKRQLRRIRDNVLESVVWPALFMGVVVGVFFIGPFFR